MRIWRLFASVLGRRQWQRQIMKHEQANRFMNRDDVLVWLSLAWFVALCGLAIWVLFSPTSHIFG